MQRSRLLIALGFLLAFNLSCSDSSALAATPAFAIAATNVTMSSSGASGYGVSTITVISVNGYTGAVQTSCTPPTPPSGVKVPYCGSPVATPLYKLAANQSVTGSFAFNNSAVAEPSASLSRHGPPWQGSGLALAGMLFFGVATRRRATRFLTLMLFAAGTLACLAGISACGGSSAATPGTYAYTITAYDVLTSKSVTTSVSVTVP